jgi:hypothetical protein
VERTASENCKRWPACSPCKRTPVGCSPVAAACACLVTRWCTRLVTRWCTRLVTRWCTRLVTRWCMRLVTRWCTRLVTRWCTRVFHALVHALVPPFVHAVVDVRCTARVIWRSTRSDDDTWRCGYLIGALNLVFHRRFFSHAFHRVPCKQLMNDSCNPSLTLPEQQ